MGLTFLGFRKVDVPLTQAQLQQLASSKKVSELSDAELIALAAAEEAGKVFDGDLPAHLQLKRERALDSPSYLAG
jgi:hypothetical protein